MQAMSLNFRPFFKNFIDIVNKIIVIFSVYFVVKDWKSDFFKVGADLVESPCFRGCFDKADFSMFGMVEGAEGFEFGHGWVGAGNDGLSDIDFAGLVFTESIQRGIDDPGFRWLSVNDGEICLMNFPALLHLAQKGGVFLAAGDKEKTGCFPIKTADEREEFPGKLFPKPVDQGEGAVGSGGVDQPTGRFVGDQETRVGAEDGGGDHSVGRIPI